ncbi:hypothetical protein, conserved [Eimeria praecox]|uniref:Uncharacterized protein n=1 Tax=Eimeria praecox TaxID=51316 RepID=U6G078_9EIME|nr:hypothetical protein, conserved [Eimeria praecox]
MFKNNLLCGPLLVALSLASPSPNVQAFGGRLSSIASLLDTQSTDNPYERMSSVDSSSSNNNNSSSSSSSRGSWGPSIGSTASTGLSTPSYSSSASGAFLQQLQQQIIVSTRYALEQPAKYCAEEGEDTTFCLVIREFAAALRSISDIECIPASEIEDKKKGKISLLELEPNTLEQTAKPHSFMDVPTQEEVKRREEEAAAQYQRQAEAAQRRGQEVLKEAGERGNVEAITEAAQKVYMVQAILQSAYYMQAGVYRQLSSKEAKASLLLLLHFPNILVMLYASVELRGQQQQQHHHQQHQQQQQQQLHQQQQQHHHHHHQQQQHHRQQQQQQQQQHQKQLLQGEALAYIHV